MALELTGLTREEQQRYSRHLMLPEIGSEGQQRIKAARVLLVGAGGLGSPLALYLAAAGVGTLGIVDDDNVEATNLQRQVLHDSSRIGTPKVESGRLRLTQLNPYVEVVPYGVRLAPDNVESIVKEYDLVADGSDNFPTRYLVNDACVALEKVNVYGSVYRFDGQASVFDARSGPCYRCLFPHAPPPGAAPSCADAGVLGVLPGIVGLIQATEVLKLIARIGEPLIGRLLMFDALEMRFRELKLAKDPDCPACGSQVGRESLSDDYGAAACFEITAAALKESIARGDRFELLDVREPAERDIAKLANTREIPLGELESRMDELSSDVPIVVYCYSGARSAFAAQQLRAAGFADVKNLSGGILAWIDNVDPALTRY
ncbi:MAG TPA: molybdopterin-synthase adenylyltransferase MoeB [Candidatus Eremiobacteraceae bacterium]|nr:molybdopterin-synthase adenylyltransferase MoeB [Candidatus Eremiobacteraceae bacterium]